MYLNRTERHSLLMIMRTQGLSQRQAAGVISMLVHWETHKGTRWVVSKLKELRRQVLDIHNQRNCDAPVVTFKSHLKCLSDMARASRRGAIAAFRVLSIYGRWEAKAPTDKEWNKFRDSIGKSAPTSTFAQRVTPHDRRVANMVAKRSKFSLNESVSDQKVVPLLKTLESETSIMDHLQICLESCPAIVRDNPWLIRTFFAEDVSWQALSYYIDEVELGMNEQVVGKISCLTSDRGMKHRFIANPHRFLQMGLSRLQDACARYLKKLPESCVYNSLDAIDWVKAKSAAGSSLYSLDLSSATDHFPLDYQAELLWELFPTLRQDISLWYDVSTSHWDTPVGMVQYNVGQPMGTAPSFAGFTVAHIHLVRTLGGTPDNFRVIGDDVVISDPDVAARYRAAMARLGVQINDSKSLSGYSFAEFAGRIIDKWGYWPCFKASPLHVSKDPLGMVRQYGLRGLKLLPRSIRGAVHFAASLSLSPLMAHCASWSNFDKLGVDDLLKLLSNKVDEYACLPSISKKETISWCNITLEREINTLRHSGNINENTTVFNRSLDDHELVLGFLLDPLTQRGSQNDPVIAQHYNAVIQELYSYVPTWLPEILSSKELDRKSVVDPWADRDDSASKMPLSTVKALARLAGLPN